MTDRTTVCEWAIRFIHRLKIPEEVKVTLVRAIGDAAKKARGWRSPVKRYPAFLRHVLALYIVDAAEHELSLMEIELGVTRLPLPWRSFSGKELW